MTPASGKLREHRRDRHPQPPDARPTAHAMRINGDPVQKHDHKLLPQQPPQRRERRQPGFS